jgi:sterol desaturase/sphingolipid hydroxylase (fatty acid hydroxylase superfamily)
MEKEWIDRFLPYPGDTRYLVFGLVGVLASWFFWGCISLIFYRFGFRDSQKIEGRSQSFPRLFHIFKLGCLNFGLQIFLGILAWPILKHSPWELSLDWSPIESPIRILSFLILDDSFFYFFHRLLHSKFFFQRIHFVHHEFRNTNPFAAIYFHPVEFLLLSFGFLIGPILLGATVTEFFLWIFIRQWIAVSGHMPKSASWDPLPKLPFHPGSEFHTGHHINMAKNYGLFFPFWDSIFRRIACLGKENN